MKQVIEFDGIANSGCVQFVIDGGRFNKNVLTKASKAFILRNIPEGYDYKVDDKFIVQIVGHNGGPRHDPKFVQGVFHI